jgi:hypothetical protein
VPLTWHRTLTRIDPLLSYYEEIRKSSADNAYGDVKRYGKKLSKADKIANVYRVRLKVESEILDECQSYLQILESKLIDSKMYYVLNSILFQDIKKNLRTAILDIQIERDFYE